MATKARRIVLNTAWCKGCGICVEICPRHVFGSEPVSGIARVERPEDCSGCGQCELLCPDYAIEVEENEA